MRITEVDVQATRMIGSHQLEGTASLEEGEVSIVIPLSQASLTTIQECVERDYDVEVEKLKCGS